MNARPWLSSPHYRQEINPERKATNALIIGAIIMAAWFVFDLAVRIWAAL